MVIADEMVARGLTLHQQGRRAEAEAAYRRVLEEWPGHADAWHLLGVVAMEAGRPDAAVELIGRAAEIRPGFAIYYGNLGEAYRRLGDFPRAVAALEEAIRLEPDHADAHLNLGSALRAVGRLPEAVERLRTAVRLRPLSALAHFNLGLALTEVGNEEEAIAELREAIRLGGDFSEAYDALGSALWLTGRLDEAIEASECAVRLDPDNAIAASSLGYTLKDAGRLEEAMAWLRRAVELRPDAPALRSSLIYSMQFLPGAEAEVVGEQREWVRRFAEPLAGKHQPHTNDRDAGKRLRVGYVSPDFRNHVVGRNILPLVENHDREQFKLFFYSDTKQADGTTERFRGCVGGWREISGMGDEAVAAMIRADGIDILVDLAQHTSGNRLWMFVLRPAPVQVSFAGYPAATGVPMIDYRLSDPYLEPEGEVPEEGPLGGERLVRLPHSFWCYDPLGETVEVNELPAMGTGRVTFGCLNNFCKINAGVLGHWAAAIREVEGSRLLILAPEGSHRQTAVGVVERCGVEGSRVEFVSRRPRREYLELYHRIDIGLDTLPYNGHTTSLDAMWMGVPVVTLVGKGPLGRAGLSQLSNVGMGELATSDAGAFVSKTAALARDLPRLAETRRSLRSRMQASPLMDARGFAGAIEKAYRGMWSNYCGGGVR
jgi:protein O-GlcNAc transferase